ncbi:MAG: suppressor of fused domain protein [Flavobacteriales bacterium]
MQELEQVLLERLAPAQLTSIKRQDESYLLITLPGSKELRVLMTRHLSDFKMKVPEKHVGEEYRELYVLIPSYWDIEDASNLTTNWVFEWLSKVKNHVITKDTWLGHGHTLATGATYPSISPKMKQNHFILSNPIELAEELAPIQVNGKTISFLALIPIFADEMDYKQGKGTAKLFAKLSQQNITEKLDDFRSTVLKSRWNFFTK